MMVLFIFQILGLPPYGGSMVDGALPLTLGLRVVKDAITSIIGFFVTAVGVTVLSKFYRHIIGGETGDEGASVGSD